MVRRQEGHPACKKYGEWWRWALVSPDGVAPSRIVGVSTSVNLPLHHKVQKFFSGTGSPGWSRKKGRKTVVMWCGENVATLRCELHGIFLTHSGLVFIVPPCVNRRVITWCTGEPVVSVLDAKDHSSELRRTDPDDPPMSSSSENLHPRSSHATCCLRAVSRIQGNSARMRYTPLT